MTTKKDLIVKISLVLIIIILLVIIFFLARDYFKEERIPTGNVDIFEIDCSTTCDCTNKGDNTDPDTNTDPNTDVPVFAEEGEFKWSSTNKLNMFENAAYEMNPIIAPNSSNSYTFIISNNTIYNMEYSLTYIEKNDYRINMKYKLKKNGEYVVGDADTWESYAKLNSIGNYINTKEKDVYILEWKWVESANDTQVGTSLDATYSLNMKLNAKQRV